MKNRLTIYAMCLLTSIISGCGGGGTVDTVGKVSSLVASYSFDETSGTSAANNADEKYQGLVFGASRVPGKVGNALQFGAPTARAEIYTFYGDGKHMSFSNNTISIGAWIKADSLTPGTYSHIAGNSYGGSETFRLQLNGDKLEFLLNDGTNYSTIITSNQRLLPSSWNHVMVTYDGTTAKLYINGSIDNSVNLSFHFDIVWNTIYVGARMDQNFSYTNQFHGIIDELKLYNTILSTTEIKTYYDSTK